MCNSPQVDHDSRLRWPKEQLYRRAFLSQLFLAQDHRDLVQSRHVGLLGSDSSRMTFYKRTEQSRDYQVNRKMESVNAKVMVRENDHGPFDPLMQELVERE